MLRGGHMRRKLLHMTRVAQGFLKSQETAASVYEFPKQKHAARMNLRAEIRKQAAQTEFRY